MEIRHAEDPVLLGVYVLIIVTGLVDCFFGYRAFKYALAILLGIIGAGVAAYFGWTYGEGSWTFAAVGLLAGGILGAVLATFFFNAAVVVAGATFGYVLIAPLIGAWEPWVQLLVLVIGCGVIGLVSIFVARFALMAATATTGSFRIIYGGWYLVGGPAFLVLTESEENDTFGVGWQVLSASREAFFAMLVLAAVGFFIQFRREQKKKVS